MKFKFPTALKQYAKTEVHVMQSENNHWNIRPIQFN